MATFSACHEHCACADADVSQFKPLFEAFQAQDKAEVGNIHVSDKVVAPQTRRTVSRDHGKM